MAPSRIFLLSPADASGKRARLLQNPASSVAIGRSLRSPDGAALGEVFAFVSSLYFRGKLAYASAFAQPPPGTAGVFVITPCDGLRTPDTRLRADDLDRYAEIPVDAREDRYRQPLLRDLAALDAASAGAEVVLLGSVASGKYVEILTGVLGSRLLFPSDFVGRGDMSRGGLLLRCVEESRELPYVPVLGATRHGTRPAKLPPKRKPRPAAGRGSAT